MVRVPHPILVALTASPLVRAPVTSQRMASPADSMLAEFRMLSDKVTPTAAVIACAGAAMPGLSSGRGVAPGLVAHMPSSR